MNLPFASKLFLSLNATYYTNALRTPMQKAYLMPLVKGHRIFLKSFLKLFASFNIFEPYLYS